MDISEPSKEEMIVKFGYKIKAKGTYNMDDLYKELFFWTDHYGYKWYELQYRKIDMGNGAYRLELIWLYEKELDEYSTFIIDLHLAADLSDVEVTSKDTGQKGKQQKGTIEFRAGAKIKKNTDVWKKSLIGKIPQIRSFNAKLYDVLNRERLNQQKEDCYTEVHKLFDELKAFMMIYK